MSQRILTFNGNASLLTWFAPESLEDLVSNALQQSGWGVAGITINYVPQPTTLIGWVIPVFFADWFHYVFTIKINALIDENPERVRNAITTILGNWFSAINLTLVDDAIQSYDNGIVVTQNTDNRPSVWDSLFGKDTSAIDAGGKILGLSTGTLILIALGYLFVIKTTTK